MPRLLVFGAIDFAAAVARLGSFLGYRVTVCDARGVFATASRFPSADEVIVDWPHRYLSAEAAAGRIDGRTVICVLTHDPKFDVPLLEVALRLPEVAYIGAMGSRRTHDDRLKRLREAGLTEAELARLASPIGLDLGARTPEETAVSIAAEIIAQRWGGAGDRLSAQPGPHPPLMRRRIDSCGRDHTGAGSSVRRLLTSGGGAMTRITVKVDGSSYTDDVEPRTLLVHYLREQLGKTGTVVGCDTGNCGACTVHLDGRSVKSCSLFAVQADGHEVTTIEGLATNGQLHPMQQAFHENHALQCGYCTPGMIMQSIDLLADNPDPDRGRGPARARGQPLPLHRLPEHRQGRPGRGRRGRCAMTTTEDRPATEIGNPRRRKEDARLITGRTRWTDNIVLPGMLHIAMVRSPFAHARITGIDTEAARAATGVVAVLTGADIADEQGALPNAWAVIAGPEGAGAPVDGGRPRRLRRRDRCHGRRPERGRGERRRRPGRRRLRGTAAGARPEGRGHGRGDRPSRISARTCRRSGRTTRPRPAPAATSRPRSRRPATAAS